MSAVDGLARYAAGLACAARGAWREAEAHHAGALAAWGRDGRAAAVDRGLVERARDGADACATAAEVAVELHRLVPAAHRRGAALLAASGARSPHVRVLADLASLLARGPAPLGVVRALHRRTPGLAAALTDREWLVVGGSVRATPRCAEFLRAVNAAHAEAVERLWPDPPVVELVVEHPMAAARTGPSPQARLFDLLRALRYQRADAHHTAAHYTAAHHTAAHQAAGAEHRSTSEDERVTDLAASAPYRRIDRARRAALVTDLRGLAD
ncbi:hypothetical protein [Actinosynnema mirum]|uniref:Uncharacterized protein n=1 Tax=Actinosynnema mirum (strain ATCC 29888 / DSM 43827 / JCM 3225 / NBRC 14064 / NCIMB 13271 / NRRL B-12336 / IMRU 3971 / 101) TaxID=446462 RepID=C6WF81_ACTMD|nr:hypothetical protein [Actinosynnema mirum]ACU34213.1 conserved hypothetical protein [Actinosynnema mirum DSM 43827]